MAGVERMSAEGVSGERACGRERGSVGARAAPRGGRPCASPCATSAARLPIWRRGEPEKASIGARRRGVFRGAARGEWRRKKGREKRKGGREVFKAARRKGDGARAHPSSAGCASAASHEGRASVRKNKEGARRRALLFLPRLELPTAPDAPPPPTPATPSPPPPLAELPPG